MHIRGNVLIIDANTARRRELETLLSFLNVDWISEPHSDILQHCQDERNVSGVLIGHVPNKPIESLISHYPKLPFVTTQALQKSYPNHIGELKKPVVYDHLVQLLHRCQSFSQMTTSLKKSDQSNNLLHLLIGQAESIQDIRGLIQQVARKDANVLITGESGTGKEVIARAIHELSSRNQGPFVPINCGAIPAELLESELFGHEKGAFTGALNQRKGRFELAKNGTLFLDEIGDMPLLMQVKLLRVLQEHVIERVGSGQAIPVNVRVIAATHRDIETMLQEQTFREDLYYRLNVFPIEIPPLRTRIDDLPILFQELMTRHAQKHGARVRLTQRALESLMQQPWYGNIRELSNLIERLVILYPNQVVDSSDLPIKYQKNADLSLEPHTEKQALTDIFTQVASFAETNTSVISEITPPLFSIPKSGIDLKQTMIDIEINYIEQALHSQQGVVARAAKLLKMQRTTLVEKMKKYGIHKDLSHS